MAGNEREFTSFISLTNTAGLAVSVNVRRIASVEPCNGGDFAPKNDARTRLLMSPGGSLLVKEEYDEVKNKLGAR